MLLDAVSPLANWANFYVIMGSSAGALTGLMFVVITLSAERRVRSAIQGVSTYTTPTVVHFGAVLLASAILSAPWPSLWQAALLLGLSSLGCMGYTVIVARRLPRLPGYDPVPEDWLFHAVFPLVAYATLAIAGFLLVASPGPALFAIGAVMILLLVTGIHNAWDIATFIAVVRPATEAELSEESEPTEESEPKEVKQD